MKYPAAEYDQLENRKLHELVKSSSTAALQSLGLNVATLSCTDPQAWQEVKSI
jgi:hypothetical protein